MFNFTISYCTFPLYNIQLMTKLLRKDITIIPKKQQHFSDKENLPSPIFNVDCVCEEPRCELSQQIFIPLGNTELGERERV